MKCSWSRDHGFKTSMGLNLSFMFHDSWRCNWCVCVCVCVCACVCVCVNVCVCVWWGGGGGWLCVVFYLKNLYATFHKINSVIYIKKRKSFMILLLKLDWNNKYTSFCNIKQAHLCLNFKYIVQNKLKQFILAIKLLAFWYSQVRTSTLTKGETPTFANLLCVRLKDFIFPISAKAFSLYCKSTNFGGYKIWRFSK